jgi:endonuclease/exonuclease/phosphatase family metal-dependent hydrolase
MVLAAAASAAAQTTVTLGDPATDVVFATLRGGTYANTNLSTILETRASSDLSYVRRAMVKFDTENRLPSGVTVVSAFLTFTVKSAGADATRRVGVYQVKTSWHENVTTWKVRKAGYSWATGGGDLGTHLATATVGNTAGAKISVDVTPLVKAAVSGQLGTSRYTRLALVDIDEASSTSYRSYYTPRDSATMRPTLTVTYSSGAAVPPPPPPPSTSTSTGSLLRVVHWNVHHNGVGMDGKLDMDRIITWVAKFKPDVVSFNEVHRNYGYCSCDAPAKFTQMLSAKTGQTWYYKFLTHTGTTNGEGNLLLSRFPFDGAGTKLLSYSRSVVNGTIIVNGRSINLFSTHLDADSTSRRLTEISQLKSWATGIAEQRIVAGDFNAWPSTTENAEMTENYKDSWAVAKTAGTAIAYPGNESGSTRGSRIDYIYYSQTASHLVLKSAQVFDTRDENGKMASDHRPILAVFEVK